MTSGGGSAQLRSTYAVTPFEGITAAANEIGAEVTYHIGTPSHNTLPLLDGSIRQGNGEPGAYMQFWNESPSEAFLSTSPDLHAKISEPAWDVPTHSTNCFLADGVVSSSNVSLLRLCADHLYFMVLGRYEGQRGLLHPRM